MTAPLDVVVVSYRCRKHLGKCLASLAQHAPPETHVCVIDNGSLDGTVEMVAERHPSVEVIANRDNLGFARASNQGMRICEARYVLLLNPDTELRPHTIEALVALMDERPDVGICGCRLERPNGTLDHACRRSFPTLLGAFGHFSGIGRRLRGGALAQYRAPGVARGVVDAVNGAFMLIRRAALDEVGLFDEGYWMYMEDLDLCYRFREAGWVVWYEPSVTVLHLKGATARRAASPRLVLAFHRGMARFYRKHYAPTRRAPANVAVLTLIVARLIVASTLVLPVRLVGVGRRS